MDEPSEDRTPKTDANGENVTTYTYDRRYGYRRTVRVSPNLVFVEVSDAHARMRRLQDALRAWEERQRAKEAGTDQ